MPALKLLTQRYDWEYDESRYCHTRAKAWQCTLVPLPMALPQTTPMSHPKPRPHTGYKGCAQCPFVLKNKEFIHPHTGYTVQLRGYFTCISKFAIYVLICPCGLIYIGETTQMVKSRISQHRSSINLGNMTLPVSKHFLEKGHTADQLKFMVLETVPPLKRGGDREFKLKQREVWWIKKLGSLYPSGLNKDHDLFLFL
ncbi:hypothetical protein XELAEV_18012922mg [Xenopus laevis]|uniref:GIY-YIG domain-containing protein n=1 Tax=Xenopus laevis TaxID=8355 RepID=A0A974HYK8_XENLA|nr:hypothetical protein XELAEV_18012922mg [Xenopus laevis]